MEKLAAEMAAAEEAARRRAEDREREATEQAEKALQQQQEAAGNKSDQSNAAGSTASPTSGTKDEDKTTPMETGTWKHTDSESVSILSALFPGCWWIYSD